MSRIDLTTRELHELVAPVLPHASTDKDLPELGSPRDAAPLGTPLMAADIRLLPEHDHAVAESLHRHLETHRDHMRAEAYRTLAVAFDAQGLPGAAGIARALADQAGTEASR